MTIISPLATLVLSAAAGLSPLSVQAAEGATTTVYITGTLVDAPECNVNGNNAVDVDFGDNITTRQIDGLNYKKQIVYTLSCSSMASNGMRVSVVGAQASFGNGLIGTDKTGLAIQLWNGSQKLANATMVDFTYPDIPELWATPVAQDNTMLTAGTFSGNASLIISYQ